MVSGQQLTSSLRTDQFDFHLPGELIAQKPIDGPRDRSRLLVYERKSHQLKHSQFRDHAAWLQPGDLLIMNNSKVIPARLRGRKAGSGGKFEIFLLEEITHNQWLVMLKPGKRTRPGTLIEIQTAAERTQPLMCEVISKTADGHYCVTFHGSKRVDEQLEDIGEIPLPPYIQRTGKPSKEDQERYQTVYADKNGSVAAPTAGLHYTPELLETLRKHGVQLSWVTLHVGLGTFNPIKTEWATDHRMHEERYEISEDTMRAIQAAKKAGRRVIAVGTTSLRVLESVASIWSTDQPARPIKQKTDIFIYPPYRFGLTDGLITNFHLPQSSLMMLVSAFSSPGSLEGIQILKDLYAEAVKERYRFFSFGDAMMIL